MAKQNRERIGMIGRTRIVPWGLAGFSVLVLISISGPVKAVDFLRGDANGDGVVSIADAHYVLNNLFRSGPALDCEDAGDANDSGALTIADAIGILNFLFLGGDPPAPPFPGAGADTTDDSLACQSYGGGSPLEDPAAKIELREVTAAGRHVFLTLALSSTASVGGYSARIFDQAGVIQDASAKVGIGSDLTGTLRDGFMGLSPDPARPQRFLAGVLIFMISDPFRAGRDVPVLGISVCLKPGTAPGEYPMILEAGELADFESGRAIHPTLVSGKIKVLST